jgi:hypothetical protein
MDERRSKDRVSVLEIVFAGVVCALTIFAFVRLGVFEGVCTGLFGFGAAYVLSTVWNPPPRKHPLPAPAEPMDPVAWTREHDEHRYDPGYWTGGRIDPILSVRRPNRYGLFLILGSFLTLGIGVFLASAAGSAGAWVFLLCAGISAVELAAGWALLRRQDK